MRGGQAAAGGRSVSGRAGFPRAKDGHPGWHGLICVQKWMPARLPPAWLVRSIQPTSVCTDGVLSSNSTNPFSSTKLKAHSSGSPVPQALGRVGRAGPPALRWNLWRDTHVRALLPPTCAWQTVLTQSLPCSLGHQALC